MAEKTGKGKGLVGENLTRTHNGAIGTSQRSDAHRNGDSDCAVERLIDFRKMWAIVLKNWMVLKGDKVRLVPLVLFPIIMIAVFGFSAGNTPKHLSAAIVDYDHTPMSQEIADSLSSVEIFAMKYSVGTQDEGRQLLDNGQIKALFVLPSGLGDDVASGRPSHIDVLVDESDSSVASIAKATAQTFTAQMSSRISGQRLAAMHAQANAANAELRAAAAASDAVAQQGSGSLAASQSEVASHWGGINNAYSKSSKAVKDSVQSMKNSLGYLVDQNEIADSFTPASMTTATLYLLATGDSQASTLQQIAAYQGIGISQAIMLRDAGAIYSNYQKLSGQAAAQGANAAVSARFIDSAEGRVGRIASQTETAGAAIEANFIEPYGYGRRGIDFLLPAIIAMAIFQGATMNLGRAIAGEKKDGSLTRVFLTPTSNTTIVLGTQMFYLLLEVVRSSFMIVVAVLLFSVTISGSVLDIIIIIAIFAIGTTGVGMVLSVMTNNQEQYMALAMLVSMPIMFLSGVFFPVQTMPPVLQGVAQFLPVTYAADALRGVMVKGFTLYQVMPDLLAMIAFGALTLALSILLFKRELS